MNAIEQRIADITPRLIAYSKFVQSPEFTQEDIQQEMSIAILEKAAKDPSFSSQNDSYIAWYATWQAKHAAQKTHTYASHVLEVDDEVVEILLSGNSIETEDPARICEFNESIEEILEMVSGMSGENKTVIKMIYLGYSAKEIAEKLDISNAAVSQRKKLIVKKLRIEEGKE